MTYPPGTPLPPDAYRTTVPLETPPDVPMTATKANASAVGAAGGSVLGIAIAGLIVKALPASWADQELAIGTIITALIAAGSGWLATWAAPRNKPRLD
jgi:predicted lipid-binding transport protein (Tim44 family)